MTTNEQKRRMLLALAVLYERSAEQHAKNTPCYKRKSRKARECRKLAEKLLTADA